MTRVIPIAGRHAGLHIERPSLGPGGATDFHRYYGGHVRWPIRADMEALGADPTEAQASQDAASLDAQQQVAVSAALQQANANLATAQKNLDDQTKGFKRDMLQAAAKVAAVQTAGAASFMIVAACIPVIGWALDIIAAIVALIGTVLGHKYKAEVASIIAGAKARLIAYQQACQVRINAAEKQVSAQLWPAAQQLAASGQPLDGLGDFWSNLRDDVKHAAKQVVNTVVKIHTLPVKIIGQQVIKGVRSVAGAVHDTNLQHKLAGKEDAWAAEIDRSSQHTSDALTNLRTLNNDALHAVNIVTGYEQVVVARKKAHEMEAAARAQMDAFAQQAIANMQTAEYQAELTRDLARAIRGDPTLMQEASYYQSQEQKLAVQNGLPASAVVPTVKSSAGGTLAATAALVGAFFMLRR